MLVRIFIPTLLQRRFATSRYEKNSDPPPAVDKKNPAFRIQNPEGVM
jgi:hypothetical protein